MAREGSAGFCSAQTYSPSTRSDPLQGPAHRPQPGAVGQRKHNEQLFLIQLPALCQMY